MSRVLLRTSRRAFGTAAATPKGGDAHHSKPAHDSHDHHDDHHHGEHHDHHDLHHHDAASLHYARVAKQRLFGRTVIQIYFLFFIFIYLFLFNFGCVACGTKR
jgi:hypothetical protein